ncbi:hypothetical protein B0T25DRAFT_600391 [Lasiosphaeria hispida]|uniref:Uncharacterized protein n=1 Tax=Lasiosphaeria hispida TaxID=260671 RepID=A0AAJ0HQ63_9PEZI|nr:hypothetical protein B0T25DRAFT_600391 [Lasiosphaeria hispida]
MPSLRGLAISIMVKNDGPEDGQEPLPEYPHPDGSSVQLTDSSDIRGLPQPVRPKIPTSSTPGAENDSARNPGNNSSRSARGNPAPDTGGNLSRSTGDSSVLGARGSSAQHTGDNPALDTRGSSTQGRKTKAQTSVYIPAPPAGSVGTSFWIPHGQYGNECGMEAKTFAFLPQESMPHDGGLIEVHAFRASSRKPRFARLDEYKPQQSTGVSTPSVGLANKDGDIHYGDKIYQHYTLIDSLENPFATFRFHYRPSDTLRQLNLIPPYRQGTIRHGPSSPGTGMTKRDADVKGKGAKQRGGPSEESTQLLWTPADEGDILDDTEPEEATPTPAPRKQYALEAPPVRFPLAPITSRRIPTPSKAARDAPFRQSYLQRPLPPLPRPLDGSSAGKRASVMSVASIAPSLAEQTKREPYDSNLQVLEAKRVPVQRATKRLNITLEEEGKPEQQVTSLASCYEMSRPSTADAGAKIAVAGAKFGIDPGEGGARGAHRLVASAHSALDGENPPPSTIGFGSGRAFAPPGYFPERVASPFGGTRLGEQRWVGPIPSPIRREEPGGGSEVANPRRDKSAGPSFFERLRRKISHSPDKMPLRKASKAELSRPGSAGDALGAAPGAADPVAAAAAMKRSFGAGV